MCDIIHVLLLLALYVIYSSIPYPIFVVLYARPGVSKQSSPPPPLHATVRTQHKMYGGTTIKRASYSTRCTRKTASRIKYTPGSAYSYLGNTFGAHDILT
ncbi:unnamed protein product [Laminaria digitata]